jgi:hypothetical protein
MKAQFSQPNLHKMGMNETILGLYLTSSMKIKNLVN